MGLKSNQEYSMIRCLSECLFGKEEEEEDDSDTILSEDDDNLLSEWGNIIVMW